jgi:hypothetical protein
MFIFECIDDVFFGFLEALGLIHITDDLAGNFDDVLVQDLLEEALTYWLSLRLHLANFLKIFIIASPKHHIISTVSFTLVYVPLGRIHSIFL